MNKIIEIKNLKKNFNKTEALKDVTFNITKGDVVGFIGPNGAGKTTTIRIILGLIKKTDGNIKVFNKDPWKDSTIIHSDISYVPGDIALWDNLTGGEIIDLYMKLHGKGNIKKKEYLIERFKFDPRKKSKTYSKGNKQKVALISALAVDAELYIFDEPTSGLDPLMELVFQEEVNKLKEKGKTILLSSHILSEVEKIVNKVIIIRDGIIVEDGKLNELRHLTRSYVHIEANEKLDKLIKLKLHDLEIKDNTATFSVDNNNMRDTLKEISKLNITKIEINHPSLEDLFMRHYEN